MTTTNHEKNGPTKSDIEKGKIMAILAYIIAFVPYLTEKKNKFVHYHSVQGLNILIVIIAFGLFQSIILSLINFTIGQAGFLGAITYSVFAWAFGVIGLILIGLDIVGLVYAAKGEMKEVPVLGKIKIISK